MKKKNKKTWKISYVLAYVTAISEHNVKSSRCYISRPTAIKKENKKKKTKTKKNHVPLFNAQNLSNN